MTKHIPEVAYFSMEIGFNADVPTYSGGLGMLAGDTIRSAADMHVPMVAVTLIHRHGYFFQHIDSNGWQQAEPVRWVVQDYLQPTDARAEIEIEGRTVHLRCWRFDMQGADGFVVPIYLLDSDVPENGEWDRQLTHQLYGGDKHYRLCQEAILGIGGVRMLEALGHHDLRRYHMNEGHAALLTLELLRQQQTRTGQPLSQADMEVVRQQCVFTTHTPVPAGHDKFDLDMVHRVLGADQLCNLSETICHEGRLNMTYLALSLSHYINGVAKRHGEVSRSMFSNANIDSITNGVHVGNWVSPPFASLFEQFVPGWRSDNFNLRTAVAIPDDELWNAHRTSKKRLIEFVNREVNAGMDVDVLTIGFARRAATYKRGDLIFDDVERLRRIPQNVGKLQIVFAGKAHPHDEQGKQMIQHIIQLGRSLADDVAVAYLPNYEMQLARMLVAGVDVWLNTPEPPLEASGTSGMKAAINGVPSLSILDGWWVEGCVEGITGWAIGADGQAGSYSSNRAADSQSLYDKLEQQVIPLFYTNRAAWLNIMRHVIALNGSYFNTQRMVQQYVLRAYYE